MSSPLVMAFAVFGIFSLMNTSLANFPDFDANVVLVMSSYPGASASDIENNLTKVLENTLNGVEDLKDITSRSKENVSIVVLEFEYGTDIDEACNNIRDKLDLVNSSLPDGASVPVLFKFGMDDMPVLILSAKADKSLMGLDKILDDKLVTPLGRVKGVGTVSVSGAPEREIHVYCDPNKLEAYGLSVSGISQIIAAENRNVPSGSIDIGTESFTLRVEKEFKDPSELLDIVVSTRNGQTVYLRDVATGSFSLPFLMSSIRASAPAEFFSFASVATKIIFFPYERPRSFILRNMSATLSMATTPDALLSAPG